MVIEGIPIRIERLYILSCYLLKIYRFSVEGEALNPSLQRSDIASQ